jgi:DNA polymerase-1
MSGIAVSIADLQKVLHAVQTSPVIAFDTETNGIHHKRKLVGYSVSTQAGGSWYIPLRHLGGPNADYSFAIGIIREIMADRKKEVWIHNAIFDVHALRNEGILPSSILAQIRCSMILAWLVDPEQELSLLALTKKYLGKVMADKDAMKLAFKTTSAENIPVSRMGPYAIDDVKDLMALAGILWSKLEKYGSDSVRAFLELEMPVMWIVEAMQNTGVKIDRKKLEELDQIFGRKKEDTHRALADMLGLPTAAVKAGSTQWLSTTFIKTLKWWRPREEPGEAGHFSTRAEMMQEWAAGDRATESGKLAAKLLLDVRKYSKLQSTYTTSMVDMLDENDRLHTTFRQVGTVTGRFTSSGPNLQNIPTRTEDGREIRKAFITEPGWVIVDADYSQIELRILAHFSQDPVMLEAYHAGEDIHQRTADEVTDGDRPSAKGINFGLNYGMGKFKLARAIGKPVEVADKFLIKYFRVFRGVKIFQESTVEKARDRGYVATLIGRRRFLPDIKSRDWALKGSAERQAINTRVQGSAADIIKIAMRNISRRLHKEGIGEDKARMVLQVHDELVLEVREEYVEYVKKLVKEEMEAAVQLTVPIIAEPGHGQNWAEAH